VTCTCALLACWLVCCCVPILFGAGAVLMLPTPRLQTLMTCPPVLQIIAAMAK
jgi:hypothetical protein